MKRPLTYRICALLLIALCFGASAATHYVDLNGINPTPPYSDWSTAATNIQDAVNIAPAGDLVLVTNGIYNVGATANNGSNRVSITHSLTVQSVNGPAVTTITGYQDPLSTNSANSIRCAYLVGGVKLCGFTLTQGASSVGGGAVFCTLPTAVVSNCIVIANSAASGGGVCSGTIKNCWLSQNVATNGAGCYNSVAVNCLIVSNHAFISGGGGYSGSYTNCSLTANSAGTSGGGVYAGGAAYLENCIAYFNTAPQGSSSNLTGAKGDYCCTAPPPPGGINNITNPPLFANAGADDFHLRPASPCINAGFNSYASGTDLDGNPRIMGSTVDIGAYEFQHPLHYVNQSSTFAFAPYTSWATAATNIQQAIDIATNGDVVLVSNGVYSSGGRVTRGTLTNRVAMTKAVTVQSVNGANVTSIQGAYNPAGPPFARCVYMTNGAALVGFTLSNGGTTGGSNPNYDSYAAGVYCEDSSDVISNCIFFNNHGELYGGGAYQGTLFNCFFQSNSAHFGGAACSNSLNNCWIWENTAAFGSGAYAAILNNCTVVSGQGPAIASCTANNSIIYFNTNFGSGGASNSNFTNSTLNYCCTTPLPSSGANNITNDPGFLNSPAGNFHLLGNSRCINAGQNATVVGSVDLDGNPRIRGGTVDIGAYEFQADATGTFNSWLQEYGLATDGSADFVDTDGDGMNNWQEWYAGTDPTTPLSVLQLLTPVPTNSASLIVTWQSVSGRNYYLQRGTNLSAQPAFTTLQSNIVGQSGTTSYIDNVATNPAPFFYRVGVQ